MRTPAGLSVLFAWILGRLTALVATPVRRCYLHPHDRTLRIQVGQRDIGRLLGENAPLKPTPTGPAPLHTIQG